MKGFRGFDASLHSARAKLQLHDFREWAEIRIFLMSQLALMAVEHFGLPQLNIGWRRHEIRHRH